MHVISVWRRSFNSFGSYLFYLKMPTLTLCTCVVVTVEPQLFCTQNQNHKQIAVFIGFDQPVKPN